MIKEENYKVANSVQLHGAFGTLGIKVLVAMGRELTKEDTYKIREAVNTIQAQLINETLLRDEKLIERRNVDKANMLTLFLGHNIFHEETKNEYHPEAIHEPWYIITTEKGRIKIGWRKRVINIDWSDSVIKKEAGELFPEEDVTKGDFYIHAWGYEKAKQYIAKLLNS